MKTLSQILICLCLALIIPIVGYGQASYWKESKLTKAYSKANAYKLVIMPISFKFDLEEEDKPALQSTCQQKLSILLAEPDNFEVLSNESVQEAINLHTFGGSVLEPKAAAAVAKELGANVIVTCTFTREDKLLGKKVGAGIGIIQTLITLTETTTNKVLYTGKARASNPLSLQDEAEYVLQLALEKLPKSTSSSNDGN